MSEWNSDSKLKEYIDRFTSDFKKVDENPMLDISCAFDMPIQYKGLTLYPVQIKFHPFFSMFVSCLTMDKNHTGDFNIVSMSYLKYLYYLAWEKKQSEYLLLLKELLLLCTRLDAEFEDDNGNKHETIDFITDEKGRPKIQILNNLYNEKDFQKIREIICVQNDVGLPNDKIHSDIQKAIDFAAELDKKTNGDKICSLESLINALSVACGIDEKILRDKSIRKIINMLERYEILSSYQLQTILSPNMDEKGRKKITHWLSETKKQTDVGRYSRSAKEIIDTTK